MATAKKLPSGSWRVNLYIGKDLSGKRQYKSFTAGTKKEAEYMAAAYNVEKRHKADPANMTVGDAIDRYIETKTAILSPSTVREYERMRRKILPALMSLRLSQASQEAVQIAMNEYAKNHSPKSVRNAHGLLSAALAEAEPDLVLRTKLPSKVKGEIVVPEDEGVKALMAAVAGKPMGLAIMIASGLGLRRSEISALKWDDYDPVKRTLRVNKAMVLDRNREWVVKHPKSYEGTRALELADVVAAWLDAAERTSEHIVDINPNNITKRFCTLRNRLGLHIRFHDLRHYNASIMLAIGVPDKYAMERMGQSTPYMLKRVYQHTMRDKQREVADKVNSYISDVMQHEMQHN